MVSWKLRQAAKKSERHETLPEPLPETLPEPLPQIPFLPYEILFLIVELSDEQSLVRLIQTCHRLRRFVEPILYRHIRAPGDDRGRNLHRMLVGRPDLLPVILSYHGPLIIPEIPEAKVAKPEGIISSGLSKGEKFWRKMWPTTRKRATMAMNDPDPVERAKIIFSGAVNIRELHVTDTIGACVQVFGTCGAPLGPKTTNIQSLVLNVRLPSPQLALILRMQPRLKHLELRLEEYVPIRLDETDLRELESLKAGLPYAAEIVPGRPVKKLELLYDWTSALDSLQQVALSTCGITEFTAEVVIPSDIQNNGYHLRAPAQYLHGIERLCFRLVGTVLDSTFSSSLQAYSSLSHFKLVGMVGRARPIFIIADTYLPPERYTQAEFRRYVRQLRRFCPNLVEVEWDHSWNGENPLRYRFHR